MPMLARRRDQLREWLVSVEQAWIGWSLAPPARVLAAEAWLPDAPTTYCHRCGGSVGAGESTPQGCGSCRGHSIRTDRVVRLSAYRASMRNWVRSIKYGAWAEMAASLGQRLGMAVAAALENEGCFDAHRTVVVPMPMPWQRRLYRGIDHARLIADGVARALGVPVRQLLSVGNGPPKVSLSSAGRRTRRGVRMRLRPRAGRLRLPDVVVVLVDDVRTSGGSLNTATRLLLRLGPRRVVAGVLAVTDDPSRRERANLPSLTSGR